MVKKVAVTGAAGQIAYQLLFRLAEGKGFEGEEIVLHLLELPEAKRRLEGVVLELQDGGFPLVKDIKITTDPLEAFKGVDYALLIGAKPRTPGMERRDLLEANAGIFKTLGQALNRDENAKTNVLVVGNPCNLNAWIVQHYAPKLSKDRIHALTFLDQTRAAYQLASKAQVPIAEVTNVTIWGNHSLNLVPDWENAKIGGMAAGEVIHDQNWLRGEFFEKVQKRGGEVLERRGLSSAGSAAKAVVDWIDAVNNPTPSGLWFSSAVYSANNPYGIDPDLIFSFPCRSKGDGKVEIVDDLSLDSFLLEKLRVSEEELKADRNTFLEIANL